MTWGYEFSVNAAASSHIEVAAMRVDEEGGLYRNKRPRWTAKTWGGERVPTAVMSERIEGMDVYQRHRREART